MSEESIRDYEAILKNDVIAKKLAKYDVSRKALAAIAASKCDCSGCIMVRAIIAFMEEP